MVRKLVSSVVLAAALPTSSFAQFTEFFEFGEGLLNRPTDVAVARHGTGPAFVVVADGDVVRFGWDGRGWNPLVSQGWGSTDVAVDNGARSTNRHYVYATDGDRVIVFDSELRWRMSLVPGVAHGNLSGIDVDLDGDLYVSDEWGEQVLKFSVAELRHDDQQLHVVAPSQVFDTSSGSAYRGQAFDVSVDDFGRVAAALSCGCIRIFRADGSDEDLDGVPSSSTGWQGVDFHGPRGELRASTGSKLRQARFEYRDQSIESGPDLPLAAAGIESARFPFYEYEPGELVAFEYLYVTLPDEGRVVVYHRRFETAPLPREASALWPLESIDALDAIGDNHGAQSGNGAVPTRGMVGQALEFSGSNAGLEVIDAPELNFGTGDFSIEGWICAADQGGVRAILDKRSGGTGYHLYFHDGYLGMQLSVGGTWRNFRPQTASNKLADGSWRHFAACVDRSSSDPGLRLYVDGQLSGVGTPLLGDLDSSASLLLGRHKDSGTGFRGAMDDLALYHRALQPEEVLAIVEAETAGKTPLAPTSGPCFSVNKDRVVQGQALDAGDVLHLDPASSEIAVLLPGDRLFSVGANLDALSFLPGSAFMLASFSEDVTIPGLIGGPEGEVVRDEDLVFVVPRALGSWARASIFFHLDGSEYGLVGSDIDGVSCNDLFGLRMLISLRGRAQLPGLDVRNEDVLELSGGLWRMFLSGRDEDVRMAQKGENVNGLSYDSAREDLYLTTSGGFRVPHSLFGENDDILRFQGIRFGADAAGSFDRWMEGATHGLSPANIDALSLPRGF